MAKKPAPKPLFAVKQDFYDSLDAVTQQIVIFRQAVNQALKLGKIAAPADAIIREQMAALDKTMMTEDE